MAAKRARELGLDFSGTPGQHNAVTDVPGLMVGYKTLMTGAGPLVTGRGPVRTGVTAILPRGRDAIPQPVWAGTHSLNGNGEMTGTHWIRDGGYLLGPIMITNTHSVGRVHQAAVKWIIDTYPGHWGSEHLGAMPVVAETYDGTLNDINGLHVTEAHAREALDQATDGPLREGNVGGGTGMVCYEFKGGTGTSSRRLSVGGQEFHVGVLVQANHGRRQDLTILGVPVGRPLQNDTLFHEHEMGSIIAVVATDVPMMPHQPERLAKRGAIGVARGGTPGSNGSGDIFLAISTANPISIDRMGQINSDFTWTGDDLCDAVYLAAVQAIEESVINALVAAEDMTALRPHGQRCAAIDIDAMLAIIERHGRLRTPPR